MVPLSWKLELPHAALAPYAFEYTVKGEILCDWMIDPKDQGQSGLLFSRSKDEYLGYERFPR